mgnify:FL=1
MGSARHGDCLGIRDMGNDFVKGPAHLRWSSSGDLWFSRSLTLMAVWSGLCGRDGLSWFWRPFERGSMTSDWRSSNPQSPSQSLRGLDHHKLIQFNRYMYCEFDRN